MSAQCPCATRPVPYRLELLWVKPPGTPHSAGSRKPSKNKRSACLQNRGAKNRKSDEKWISITRTTLVVVRRTRLWSVSRSFHRGDVCLTCFHVRPRISLRKSLPKTMVRTLDTVSDTVPFPLVKTSDGVHGSSWSFHWLAQTFLFVTHLRCTVVLSSKAFIGPIPSWVWAALRLKQSISMSAPRHAFSDGVTRGPKRTWPGCGKSGGRWLMWIDSSMIFNECFGVPRFWYPQTPKLDPPQLPMYGVSLEGHQGDWGLRAYSSRIFLCLMWLKPPENATERNGMVDPKAIDPIVTQPPIY